MSLLGPRSSPSQTSSHLVTPHMANAFRVEFTSGMENSSGAVPGAGWWGCPRCRVHAQYVPSGHRTSASAASWSPCCVIPQRGCDPRDPTSHTFPPERHKSPRRARTQDDCSYLFFKARLDCVWILCCFSLYFPPTGTGF